ncbi:MAG: hypothetical protein IT424_14430 [Pirellulales bacterium]|nr:hypothetical protein [Pirellulales bacterium]
MRRRLLFAVAALAACGLYDQTWGQTAPSAAGNQRRGAAERPAATAAAVPYAAGDSNAATGGDEAAQRLEIWNSREMKDARDFIVQYSRRSVQFTPSEAQQYLARLEQMSAPELKSWLQRYQARRAQIARSTELARRARQQSVAQALQRIEGARQSAAKFNQNQTQAAEDARQRLQQQALLAGQAVGNKAAARGDTLDMILAQNFNPFAPTLDPASPNAYTRWAAAASLPGDLIDANGNNIRGTDVDVANLNPTGAAAYLGGVVPGSGSLGGAPAGAGAEGTAAGGAAGAGASGGGTGSP